jgi:hypothetical protein
MRWLFDPSMLSRIEVDGLIKMSGIRYFCRNFQRNQQHEILFSDPEYTMGWAL